MTTTPFMKAAIITLPFVLALLTGCGGKSGAEAGSGQDAPGARHAETGAIPGSHADWCAEHAVPESKCTRCDASLVAAFKATKDWCGEHGLPESQCLDCNPDLKIERPRQ